MPSLHDTAVTLIHGKRRQQPIKEKLDRIDNLSHAYVVIAGIFVVLAFIAGLCFFANDKPRIGVPLLIAVAAFLTYGFNTHLQRKLRVGENTSGVLIMLRSRWDELRTDKTLSEIISGDKPELSNIDRIKLRFFLHTLFDVFEYAIHLISNGYFNHPESLSLQYKNLIQKTLSYPFVVDIWKETNEAGEATFQNEYTQQLREVVNAIIEEMQTTASA